MPNPIVLAEAVVSDFLRYQLTTYPFADACLRAQMRALLSLDETRATPLMKGPFVSLSAAFREGPAVGGLIREGLLHPLLASIAPYPSVYGHQQSAIEAIA